MHRLIVNIIRLRSNKLINGLFSRILKRHTNSVGISVHRQLGLFYSTLISVNRFWPDSSSHFKYVSQLKCSWVEQDAVMECDQMMVIIQHSSCGLHIFICVAVL